MICGLFPMISFSNLMRSGFRFRSLLYCELILYKVRCLVSYFCMQRSSFPNTSDVEEAAVSLGSDFSSSVRLVVGDFDCISDSNFSLRSAPGVAHI